MNNNLLPPWGIPNEDHKEGIKNNKYKKVISKCIKNINEVFSTYNLEKMTKKDLKFLNKIQNNINKKVSYSNIFNEVTHKDLFISEDKANEVFDKIISYFKDKGLILNKEKILDELFSYNGLLYELKFIYNRCRPLQAAKILNIDIIHHRAISGNSPSFPSGHAFQGIQFGYLIFNSNIDYFINNSDDLELLTNIAIDIGLRRCYAGLHFFTDFLSAFIIFQTIIKNKPVNPYLDLIKKKININMISYCSEK